MLWIIGTGEKDRAKFERQRATHWDMWRAELQRGFEVSLQRGNNRGFETAIGLQREVFPLHCKLVHTFAIAPETGADDRARETVFRRRASKNLDRTSRRQFLGGAR